MIASLALLLATQAQLPQLDLGGVRTQAAIPRWTPDPVNESRLKEGDWTYHFKNNRLIGRSKNGGGWDEVSGPRPESASPIQWPIKFYVTGSLDQIGETEAGLWLPRRYMIDGDELRALRSEVSLFSHLVTQYTGGRFNIQPDFEVDNEVRLLEPSESVPDALSDVLKGRLITNKPYRSCFAITPELDFQPTVGYVGSVPTTYLPFFAVHDMEAPGQVARALYNAWVEQVQFAAAREGYPIASAPLRYPDRTVGRHLIPLRHLEDAIKPGMLADLADAATPNIERNAPNGATPSEWVHVSDSPWAKLPLLKPSSLGVEIGRIPNGAVIGKTVFPFDEMGSLSEGGRLWVQDRYIDLFASKLSGRKILGYLPIGGRVLVAFEAEGTGEDASTLGVKPEPVAFEAGPAQTAIAFDADQAEKLAVTGYFLRKTVVDNDRGAVGEIRQYPRPRHGWVRLLGYGTDQVMFDAAKTPFLEFWVKAAIGTQPIELVATSPDGDKRFALFGRTLREVSKKGVPNPVVDLQVNGDGAWQKIVIDLRAGGTPASLPITNLYLAAPPDGAYWSPSNPYQPILLDDLKVTESASSPAASVRTQSLPLPIADATDPMSRAAWAANVGDDPAKLRELIADKDYLVMLNAVMKFGTRKDPLAIPMLVPVARSFMIRPSRLAYNALAAQDSDEAWTAINLSLTQGPFDWNKREGARLIIQRDKSAKMTSQLSLLFVSPSWETRIQAARSLAMVEGEAAKIVSMSFVNAIEPAVRQACIEVADVNHAPVADRMLSLLDPASEPSDYIRALAAAKLLSAGQAKYTSAVWRAVPTLVPEAVAVFVSKAPANAEFKPNIEALKSVDSSAVRSAVDAWLRSAGG